METSSFFCVVTIKDIVSSLECWRLKVQTLGIISSVMARGSGIQIGPHDGRPGLHRSSKEAMMHVELMDG